ncbi:NlpC/P60 family protein [Halobacillus alkaliphilus]|uniref:NlpC/P60 family protein n=1 Tax=Halobacillus alkaliphilus TaxID=396056 RepID=A0A1I2M238_9BACI|nr:NlpC/P60 family protein [Halobacillus alkaliphilus]SFF85573.1 NlpC/P60 family protein [Halobacillus alkaliphilus]
MKKYWMIVAVLLLSLAFGSSVQAEDKEMYVDVSVATLWSEPDQARELDAPSLSNPVDMWEWTESMTTEEKIWLVGELQTQALYGQKVTILEEDGYWVKVAVESQPTPKNELGYPAWMPKNQLADERRYSVMKKNKPFALVTKPTVFLYDDKKKSQEFKEISFNTRLPVVAQAGDMVLVATPSDAMKWVNSNDVSIYNHEKNIPDADGKDLVETGKQFLDLPYLWAGTSGFGFDCSGFTHTIHKAHGITIPRDSSVQAEHGTPVEKENLQKGDLLFFAYDEGEGYVHHVGMYIGEGQMIHAPNSRSTVEIIDVFESDYYSSEFAGARRYID